MQKIKKLLPLIGVIMLIFLLTGCEKLKFWGGDDETKEVVNVEIDEGENLDEIASGDDVENLDDGKSETCVDNYEISEEDLLSFYKIENTGNPGMVSFEYKTFVPKSDLAV